VESDPRPIPASTESGEGGAGNDRVETPRERDARERQERVERIAALIQEDTGESLLAANDLARLDDSVMPEVWRLFDGPDDDWKAEAANHGNASHAGDTARTQPRPGERSVEVV